MDTSIDNAFYVFNQDNSYVRFAYDEKLGLYTITIDHKEESINFVTIVSEQEKSFSLCGVFEFLRPALIHWKVVRWKEALPSIQLGRDRGFNQQIAFHFKYLAAFCIIV